MAERTVRGKVERERESVASVTRGESPRHTRLVSRPTPPRARGASATPPMRASLWITLFCLYILMMVKCHHCHRDFVLLSTHRPLCKDAARATALQKRVQDVQLSRPTKAARREDGDVSKVRPRDADSLVSSSDIVPVAEVYRNAMPNIRS
jgi:hypothetical protein